jgi:hypothetical protein
MGKTNTKVIFSILMIVPARDFLLGNAINVATTEDYFMGGDLNYFSCGEQHLDENMTASESAMINLVESSLMLLGAIQPYVAYYYTDLLSRNQFLKFLYPWHL